MEGRKGAEVEWPLLEASDAESDKGEGLREMSEERVRFLRPPRAPPRPRPRGLPRADIGVAGEPAVAEAGVPAERRGGRPRPRPLGRPPEAPPPRGVFVGVLGSNVTLLVAG